MIAPLIQMVNEMSDLLEKELAKLKTKQDELDSVTQLVALKQADLKKIQDEADAKNATLSEFESKLYAAQSLIGSLDQNKTRWEKERDNYNRTKINLVGDVGVGCAFVAYCGPFNSEFRKKMTETYFIKLADQLGVKHNESIQNNLINFLVSNDKIG